MVGQLLRKLDELGIADNTIVVWTTDNGAEVWEFEGQIFSQVGMNAIAGRRKDTVKLEPFRFEHMRPGCFDIEARIRDMDIGGLWASATMGSMNSPR